MYITKENLQVDNKRLKLQLDVLKSVIDQDHPHQYLNGTEDNFLANIVKKTILVLLFSVNKFKN